MHDLYLVFAVIGGLIIQLGVFSGPIKTRLPFSIPLLSMLFGILLGPIGLNLLAPSRWGSEEIILEEAARLTLAIGLVGVALRLPQRYFLENRRFQVMLIGVIMPAMWLVTALLA